MKWRVIPYSEQNAHLNMAIDEAVMEQVKDGGMPTIRFYGWSPSAVSIGCFQDLEDEIDLEKCRELKVDFVRRRTGGGAVYHDLDGEVTYSVIGKEENFPKNIIESYKLICGWLQKGLEELGLKTDFKPINDICLNEKKISGNAQTRRQKVLLQHGTVLYDVDVKKMFSLLKVPNEKIRDKMIQAVEERVTCIKKHGNFSKEDCYKALFKGFIEGKSYEVGQLTNEEKERAEFLARTKYSTKEWNFKRE
ncbi:MAG TPA: biotin/lipoate A/B protein ligase family protein [Candidatus Bilamarchaeaceae archaeon]|nr:biotin/lipoate A/B protein ligase family protein [Candidatus Bilamarchaeaceae archaeon]